MKPIQLLDQHTVNKIAAGEVVEKPFSVVKELVENSIDAGASAITVEIKEGGISYIRITDNGVGIPKDQIKTAFLRHSTSKIRNLEDLLSIFSLGFRGEALASIAAVSQIEMMTKVSESLTGIRFVIEGGEVKSEQEIGCPEGTTIIIRNLFYNTPARRKFLKRPSMEASYISDLLNKIAVGHPEISFKYINNNSVSLHTSGNNDLKNSVFHVYGKQMVKNLVEINYSDDNIEITGYIGKPQLSRGNRSYESYYINGRFIKSKLIQKAVEDGYKNFIPTRNYPVVILHVNINPSDIDVNVHPTKMEVRFKNEDEVYSAVYHTVFNKLKQNDLIPQLSWDNKNKKEELKKPTIKENLPEPFEIDRNSIKDKIDTKLNKQQIEQKKDFIKNNVQNKKLSNIKESETSYNKIDIKKSNKGIKDINSEQINIDIKKIQNNFCDFNIIGQLFNTYWIIEKDNKMLIIDQHAAHERIMFEKFKAICKEGIPNSQVLLNPIVINVTDKENIVLKQYINIFAKFGFEIEEFGDNSYIVRSLPYIFNNTIDDKTIIEMIDKLQKNNVNRLTDDLLIDKIALLACKAAVKANNRLSLSEVKSLIKQLFMLENPYNCPHGRPTIISMTKYELERKFKRA